MNRLEGFISIYSLSVFLITPIQSFSRDLYNNPGDEVTSIDSVESRTMVYAVNPEMDFAYHKPERFQFFKFGLRDIAAYTRNTFQKKNSLKIGAMAAGTALLVALDQLLIDKSQEFGKK